MRTTYQQAEAVREAEECGCGEHETVVQALALDYMEALSLLERIAGLTWEAPPRHQGRMTPHEEVLLAISGNLHKAGFLP